MPSITMQGEGFGSLAADSIIRNAATEAEFRRLVAAFKIFLEATVALKRREEGDEAAWAFHHAARAALNERIAFYAQQDGQDIRPVREQPGCRGGEQ